MRKRINIKWNEYTWYSKLIAAIFFIFVLPVWTFYVGTQFENAREIIRQANKIKRDSIHAATPGDTVKYEMVTVRKDFTLPRVTDFYDKDVQNKVNDAFDKIAHDYTCLGISDLEYLRDEVRTQSKYSDKKYTEAEIIKMNEQEAQDALGWFYIVNSKVTYASNDIFSININTSLNCGGAHPGASNDSMTFDMKTGKEVELKDLFINFKRDKTALAEIVKAQKSLEPEGEVDTLECSEYLNEYFSEGSMEFASYYISKRGLVIIPALPHVVYVCTREYVVPISKISQYWNPEGILARLKPSTL